VQPSMRYRRPSRTWTPGGPPLLPLARCRIPASSPAPTTARSYLGCAVPLRPTDGELKQVPRGVHVPVDDQAASLPREEQLGEEQLGVHCPTDRTPLRAGKNWSVTISRPPRHTVLEPSCCRTIAKRGRPGIGPTAVPSRPRSGPPPPPCRTHRPAPSWPCARHRGGGGPHEAGSVETDAEGSGSRSAPASPPEGAAVPVLDHDALALRISQPGQEAPSPTVHRSRKSPPSRLPVQISPLVSGGYVGIQRHPPGEPVARRMLVAPPHALR
jgi:hypothetical protein